MYSGNKKIPSYSRISFRAVESFDAEDAALREAEAEAAAEEAIRKAAAEAAAPDVEKLRAFAAALDEIYCQPMQTAAATTARNVAFKGVRGVVTFLLEFCEGTGQ